MDHLNPQMSQNCVQYGKVPPLLLCRSVCGANPHPSAVHCRGSSIRDICKILRILDPPCPHFMQPIYILKIREFFYLTPPNEDVLYGWSAAKHGQKLFSKSSLCSGGKDNIRGWGLRLGLGTKHFNDINT